MCSTFPLLLLAKQAPGTPHMLFTTHTQVRTLVIDGRHVHPSIFPSLSAVILHLGANWSDLSNLLPFLSFAPNLRQLTIKVAPATAQHPTHAEQPTPTPAAPQHQLPQHMRILQSLFRGLQALGREAFAFGGQVCGRGRAAGPGGVCCFVMQKSVYVCSSY